MAAGRGPWRLARASAGANLAAKSGLLWLGGRGFLFLEGGGGWVARERGPEEVSMVRTQDTAMARFGGVARARCEGEGLEHAWVNGSHAVQHKEEELISERVELRRGEGRGETEAAAAAATLGLAGRCLGHGFLGPMW
jgi:hypothetical protein